MRSVLAGSIRDMRRVTRQKRIVVAEIASHFRPLSRSKAAWIRRGYKATYERWPSIAAVIYLDTRVARPRTDWRLIKPNDGSALEAYADIAALSRFKGKMPLP
jgi:hypothetical protein